MHESKQLRKEILARRDRLSPQERARKSELIGASLLASEAVQSSSNIFIYVSFRSEVETLALIKKLLGQGKKVSVPLTKVAEKRLEIVPLEDPDNELVPGCWNIPEPKEALAAIKAISAEQLDLIVLPGSVFDERGGRFGYGGGYYDRLLSEIPSTARYALAFEVQLVEKLELEEHDQLLDCIITEGRIITPPSRL